MEAFTETTTVVFLALTVVLMGGTGSLTGRAFAATWRPAWKVLPACLLLGGADRFLAFSLFGAELLSPTGYTIDTVVITLSCLIAYRLTRVKRMVTQYPWIYERAGPWRYREIRNLPES